MIYKISRVLPQRVEIKEGDLVTCTKFGVDHLFVVQELLYSMEHHKQPQHADIVSLCNGGSNNVPLNTVELFVGSVTISNQL